MAYDIVEAKEAPPPVTGPITYANYPSPTQAPVLPAGIGGVHLDFNAGGRLLIDKRPAGAPDWTVRMKDLGTGNTLFEGVVNAGMVYSSKNYFVRLGFEIEEAGKVIWSHGYDCRGKDVAIHFPVGTTGDVLAWTTYAVAFQKKHDCRLIVTMSDKIIPLLAPTHPHITFMTPDDFTAGSHNARVYASYYVGLFFDDAEGRHQPIDFRQAGLHKTAAYILGVEPEEKRLSLACDKVGQPIDEPYIVIATKSTSAAKHWNNPGAWEEVIEWAKTKGYRVICIDQKRRFSGGFLGYPFPEGAEDQTGDRPLTERARWIKHAAAFVGLSSGLAWLAWHLGTPTVLISGFTLPFNEFETTGRVINFNGCTGCWNDVNERFDHTDFMWCPRHAGTKRQFECTGLITASHVIKKLEEALA